MIYALVEYINKNGKISLKAFTNENATNLFVAKLQKRNAQYIITIV